MFLDDFQVVALVAETKSFSRAAKIMYISQPAVSNKIQAIEDYYGIKLFNRSTQGATVTEAGKLICAYAIRFVDLHKSMKKELDELKDTNRPWLTIGSSCTVGNYAMPRIIQGFKEKYPNANIKLDIDNSKNILGKMERNEVDVAVVEGKVVNPLFNVQHLDDMNLVLVGLKSIKGKKNKEIRLAEIIQQPFIMRESGAAVRVILDNLLKEHGYDLGGLNIALEATSIHSVKAAIEQGFGYSLVPAVAVHKELQTGSLNRIRIKEFVPELTMDISLVHPSTMGCSEMSAKFVNFMGNAEKYGYKMELHTEI